MLAFTNQQMKLTSVNVRRELAGKNPEDGRRASDVQLVVGIGVDGIARDAASAGPAASTAVSIGLHKCVS